MTATPSGSRSFELLLALALIACGPSLPANDGARPQPTASVAIPPSTSAPFGASGAKRFARVTFRRFQLDVELPDPDGWHPVRGKSRFVELSHAASGSRLILRTWFDHDNMDRARCEEGARLYRDLPNGHVTLREPAASPEGFDTEVTVGAVPGPPAQSYLNAFGARARRCFAFSFVTDASEDRLAIIRERTLATIRLLSEIDVDPREKPDAG